MISFRFNLKENTAILATGEMKRLKEIAMKSGTLVPGGSCLNTARCAQALLSIGKVSFFGSIGRDEFGGILQRKCAEIGLRTAFQVKDNDETGTCIAIINEERKTR